MMDYRAKIRDYASIIDDLFEKYQDDPIPAAHRLDEADCGKIEFARGCFMHRGFYCPSPIEEFVISNVRRGHLQKKRTASSTYEYSFDRMGQLRKAVRICKFPDVETIWREGNFEIGLTATCILPMLEVVTLTEWNSNFPSFYCGAVTGNGRWYEFFRFNGCELEEAHVFDVEDINRDKDIREAVLRHCPNLAENMERIKALAVDGLAITDHHYLRFDKNAGKCFVRCDSPLHRTSEWTVPYKGISSAFFQSHEPDL